MERMLRLVYVVGGILFGVAVVLFAYYNQEPASHLSFLYWETSTALAPWAVALLGFVCGLALPAFLWIGAWFSWGRERRRLKRRVTDLEREVGLLRNQSIEERPAGS